MNKIIVCTKEVEAERVLKAYEQRRGVQLTKVTPCQSNEQLLSILEREERWQSGRNEPFFTVKTAEGKQLCPHYDIVFCRSDGHRFLLKLADGTELTSRSTRCRFSESVAPLLKNERFISCASTLLVNAIYIRRVTPEEIILFSGEVLPISGIWQEKIRRQLAH